MTLWRRVILNDKVLLQVLDVGTVSCNSRLQNLLRGAHSHKGDAALFRMPPAIARCNFTKGVDHGISRLWPGDDHPIVLTCLRGVGHVHRHTLHVSGSCTGSRRGTPLAESRHADSTKQAEDKPGHRNDSRSQQQVKSFVK